MIDQFLGYLRFERNRSELTVKSYRTALEEFEAYFKEQDGDLSWESVDSDVIRGWMEQLMDRGEKATTVNTKLSAVRSMYRFALTRKMVSKDPSHSIVGPKKKKPLPVFVREEEMNKLLDDQKNWKDNYNNVRARTIILLLYETGLRRAELIGLNDSDVDLAQHQLKVTGKRDKQRIVPFGDELADVLRHYIEVRNDKVARNSNALFLNKHGERITKDLVYKTVRDKLSLVTFMKKRSPHVLRHSFATAMLNNGAGLESVKQLLGHESLETTEIYTHTTFEQLQRVYKEAHPRGAEPL